MFTTLTIIGLLILGQITKKYIIPKYGNHGLYVFLFVIALIINGVRAAMTYWPGFATIVLAAGTFLVSTVGIYEVIFNKMGLNITDADLSS